VRAEIEFIFKHAVTQDVTYNSLLMARRKELHRVTAEAVEALFPQQLEELSATLAYHYERAEAREKAISYLAQAAERARRTYSNAEALAFYRSALGQAQELRRASHTPEHWREQAVGLHEKIGDVLVLLGRYDESRNLKPG
jgi:predicted ATPase